MVILNKDKILDSAQELVAQGKIDKAIREYEKILAIDPKDMRVKLRIAELFVKRRQIPQAIKTYREVSDSYTHDGFYLKAVTILKNILRLNPSLLEVNQNLADLYDKMGLNQDAAYQFEILANAFEQKGKYQEALATWQKLVTLLPEQKNYRFRLAEACQRENLKEEAVAQYEALAEQYRKQKTKEPKRLIELYEKILPSRPDNRELLTELVELYFERKEYTAAIKWLESRKSLVEGDPNLLLLQARGYSLLNQLDSARAKFQQLAELHVGRGETDEALQAFEEILAVLPEEGETLRPEVEKIKPGSFSSLLARAGDRRQRAAEEAEFKEQKPEPKEVVGAKTLKETPMTKKKEKLKPKPEVADPAAGAEHLRKANAALALAKVYRGAGLAEEAAQEVAHAQQELEQLLRLEPGHPEAKRLLQQCGEETK